MTAPSTGDHPLASLRAAAVSDEPEALHRLAIALGERQASVEAFTLHKRAAIAGLVAAQLDLAQMLSYGIGCNADPRTAVYWLRRAEASGCSEASYHLASIALGGVAMPRDGRINERMLAAVQGDYPPALRAAAIHFGRKHGEADQNACVQLLDRAASHGDIVSAQLLAERVLHGEGCTPQPAEAGRLQRRLAAMGIAPLPSISIAAADAAMASKAPAMPPGTIALEDALHAEPARTLSTQPAVMQIDGLLSVDECRLLVACAQHEANAAHGIDAQSEDMALRIVQLRLARSSRMELAQAEPLRIMRCLGAGDFFEDDDSTALPALAVARAGERVRTIHVFLNAGDEGGRAFDVAGMAIMAVPGRALIVDGNASRDPPSSAPAQASDDHGAPWMATLHFRHRRYRDF